MRRTQLDDLAAFAVLAEARSFTRAAGRLGLLRFALSHLIGALEERLGMQLLVRTTRSVALTDAGKRLLAVLRPALDDIGAGLAILSALSDTPAGTLRITTFRHAAATIVGPALPDFLARYPQIQMEVRVDDELVDIVAERFDAGIQWDDKVGDDDCDWLHGFHELDAGACIHRGCRPIAFEPGRGGSDVAPDRWRAVRVVADHFPFPPGASP